MGTSAFFEELFFNYHSEVVRTAFFVLNDLHLAEDVAQDVFSKLWEKKTEIGQIDNLKAYLRTSAKNSALNRLEHSKRMMGREQQFISYHFSEVEDRDTDTSKSFLKEIEKVMEKLPPKCRLIFSMSRFENLSNSEIAERLDISKRTVETQISVALKFLRIEFKDRKEEFLPIYLPVALAAEIFF